MVMRFDPFRELNELFNAPRRPAAVPMDAYRAGETFYVRFDLPGVDPSSIDVTVEKNVLTVRADRESEWNGEVEVLVAERPTGTYSRQLFLGETLDTDRLEANYERGVLTLRIPVAEAAKPRKVAVTAGD